MDKVLLLDELVKVYPPNRRAVSNVDAVFLKGESAAVLGGPGSGKTTLMRLACGLVQPSGGSVTVLGRQLAQMGEKQMAEFRNTHMGIVQREAVFLEGLTAAENTAIPLIAGGMGMQTAVQKAKELLQKVGLGKRINSSAGGLSMPERNMIQLARAAIRQPEILLLDELGGDLTEKEKEKLLELLRALSCAKQCTVIYFTSDRHLAERFNRIVTLRDGEIIEE